MFMMTKIYKGHWRGPYGVYIPDHITIVKTEDGCNTLSKDGHMTEMFSLSPMNEQTYKERYATKIGDVYYYKS